MVAGGAGFHSYFIHQGNKLDKERKVVRNKLNFMHTNCFNIFFKIGVQFRLGATRAGSQNNYFGLQSLTFLIISKLIQYAIYKKP